MTLSFDEDLFFILITYNPIIEKKWSYDLYDLGRLN